MNYEDATPEFIAADAAEIRKGDTIVHGTSDGNKHHVEKVATETVDGRTLVVYEGKTARGERITAHILPTARITIRRFV